MNKISKDKLYDLYVNRGLSTRKIGNKLGYTSMTILRYLKKYDIFIKKIRYNDESISRYELYELYINQTLSPKVIAKIMSCSLSTIRNYLKKYNIPIRNISKSLKGIKKVSDKQKLSISKTMKSKKLFGSKNYNWRGGKTINAGYVWISYPIRLDGKMSRYMLEHRLVMENWLQRRLTSEEVVHHINREPNDNRIENLMLFKNQKEHLNHKHSNKIYEKGWYC